MKALFCTKYGSVDHLEFREIPIPEPLNDEVRIRINASSINSWDWDLVRGKPFYVKLVFPGGLKKPKAILGCDISGVVEKAGPSVKHLGIGDEVFGDLSNSGWGGFSEYVCAPESIFAIKPKKLSFEEAASLPQAGVLALQGLRDSGLLSKGEHVVINGGGGGVGALGLQMAKNLGGKVSIVDHGQKREKVMQLNPDEFIDYTTEDYLKKGRTYDLILDVVGNRSYTEYKNALKSGGRYVMVGGSASLMLELILRKPFTKTKSLWILPHEVNNKDLKLMSEWVENDLLKPVIDKVYPLDQAAQALQYLGNAKAVGKVVLRHNKP